MLGIHRAVVPQMRGFARGAEYGEMNDFAFVPPQRRGKGKALSSFAAIIACANPALDSL